jgi:hypothetical protein
VDTTSLGVNPFTQVLLTPFRRLRVSPRVDYQLKSEQHSDGSLRVHAQLRRTTPASEALRCPPPAYNTLATDQTLQATETAVLSAKVINETRFQFFHTNTLENTLNRLVTRDQRAQRVQRRRLAGGP